MATSLLDWIGDLLRDNDAREAFLDHPDRYAEEHGFHNLSSADVHDALSLIADGDRSPFDHGVHYPAPQHWDGDGHDGAHYLRSYISDNHRDIERHDTDIDNSVHQDIDTGDRGRWDRDDHDRHDHDRHDHDRHDRDHDRDRHDRDWDGRHHDGGDFNQVIDNDPVVASGNGAVAAGGDIEDSTITSGHGNVVGDDNQAVTGDGNTTAFGSGDATSADLRDTHVDDGGAISIGGDASGHNEDNDTVTSVRNSGDGDTAVNTAGSHGYANQDVDQSHEDNSDYRSYEDNSSRDSHDDYNSHNDSRYEQSHDVDIHH